MENLKIKINGDLDEIIDLVKQLGCRYFNHTGSEKNYLLVEDGRTYFCKLKSNFKKNKGREVTISELRDMVILKRNDVGDATHVRNDGKKYFHAKSTDYFYQFSDDSEWLLSTWMNYQLLPQLQPIEKTMKEFLLKDKSGNWHYNNSSMDSCHAHVDKIEIPEGAEVATVSGLAVYFWKPSENKTFFDNVGSSVCDTKSICTPDSYLEDSDVSIIWQRESEQDEPFLTPECTLNDQYAELELVRQEVKTMRIDWPKPSAWDTQIGGNHYKQFKIQPMQFALENKLDAAQQNVIKYVMRHSFKNGKQDLEKAKHYIDLMIEFYYGDNNNG